MTVFILNLFVLYCVSLFFLLPATLAMYPEYCDDVKSCVGLGEMCVENLCICDIANKWEYETKKDRCLRLSGGFCKIPNTNDNQYEDEDFEIWDCIENSICSPNSKTCECLPNYESSITGECKKSLGAFCNETELCNDSAFLKCDKTTSSCICMNPDEMIYDQERRTCVAKVSEQCEFEMWMGIRIDCERNSLCVKKDDPDPDDPDPDTAEFYGVCKCAEGFSLKNSSNHLRNEADEKKVVQAEQSCGKNYGESCMTHSDCFTGYCHISDKNNDDDDDDQGSIKICTCPNSAVYDKHVDTCRIKVGGNCDNTTVCVENAICHPNDSMCACDVHGDFFRTADDLCKFSQVITNDDDKNMLSQGVKITAAINFILQVDFILVCSFYFSKYV